MPPRPPAPLAELQKQMFEANAPFPYASSAPTAQARWRRRDAALTTLKPAGRAAHPEGVQPVSKSPSGVNLQNYNGEPTPVLFKKLDELIAAGPFHVEIAKTFSLDEMQAAHAMLKTSFLGKLALESCATDPAKLGPLAVRRRGRSLALAAGHAAANVSSPPVWRRDKTRR